MAGCISFVHQRDTVDLSLPNSSASHLADLSFSTSSVLILLYLRLANFYFVQGKLNEKLQLSDSQRFMDHKCSLNEILISLNENYI